LTGWSPLNMLTCPTLFPLPDLEHWARLVLPYRHRFAGFINFIFFNDEPILQSWKFYTIKTDFW
jgi:hypothetical protein